MPQKKQKTVFYAVVQKENKHIESFPCMEINACFLTIFEDRDNAEKFIKKYWRQPLAIKKIKTIIL